MAKHRSYDERCYWEKKKTWKTGYDMNLYRHFLDLPSKPVPPPPPPPSSPPSSPSSPPSAAPATKTNTMPKPKGPEKRIGRAERDETIDTLGRHLDDERITLEEFKDRMTAAMEAKTGSQLRKLTEDLPALPSKEPDLRGIERISEFEVPRWAVTSLIVVATLLLLLAFIV